MTGNAVDRGRNGERSGAQTLLLLSEPVNALILRALGSGPKQQTDLRLAAGSPAQTTLRARLNRLVEIDAIEKHRRNKFPGVLEYELRPAGRELLGIADVVDRWLERRPERPLLLGENAARAVVRSLAEGWSTTILRALSARPLSLTELDSLIGSLSYPSLERRLSALRFAELVKWQPSNGRGTPYVVTNWLRLGVAPLAAASRWERRRRPELQPPRSLDVEAAFLLTMPLLGSLGELSGTCRLVAGPLTGKRDLAGVMAEVDNGKVVSCKTNLQGNPNAWALGSVPAWFSALIDNDRDLLEVGGDAQFANALIERMHRVLFAPPATRKQTAELDAAASIEDDGSS